MVLRIEPCLFRLSTLIAFWFANLSVRKQNTIHVHCLEKTNTTFSDALIAVRTSQCRDRLFQQAGNNTRFDKLSAVAKNAIIRLLTMAA